MDTKPCPFCGETIKAVAIKCRFCTTDLMGSKPVPESSKKKTLRLGYLYALGATLILVWMLSGSGKSTDSNAPSNTPVNTDQNAIHRELYVAPRVPEQILPPDESELLATVNSAKAHYKEAANEFQKSTVRSDRAHALAGTLRLLSVTDWIGTVSSMTTTSDGHGTLAIKLPGESATIQTWNNGFSDIGSGTLIAHGSPLYEQVSLLAVGNTVVFSGTFATGDLDYVKEASMTEEGSITDPAFIFTFTSIRLK